MTPATGCPPLTPATLCPRPDAVTKLLQMSNLNSMAKQAPEKASPQKATSRTAPRQLATPKTVAPKTAASKAADPKKILVIDNFDSFVYVLVNYLGTLGAEPQVYRNNQLLPQDLNSLTPDAVLVSPGPGRPETAGISNATVEYFASRCPVLGVCLGHQCIAQTFGAEIVRAAEVCHGKTSDINHDSSGIFTAVPNPLRATRYHSLLVAPDSIPDTLEITASAQDGTIMGIRHKELPVEGLQFHPESVLTDSGYDMLENFLAAA